MSEERQYKAVRLFLNKFIFFLPLFKMLCINVICPFCLKNRLKSLKFLSFLPVFKRKNVSLRSICYTQIIHASKL